MSAGPLDALYRRARARPQHIVLAEGTDARVVEGGLRAARDGLARISLVGPADQIRAATGDAGLDIHDPEASALTEELVAGLVDARKHKALSAEDARAMLRDPLIFAAMMVRLGHADGSIAGAVATTADTVRAALQGIGRADGVRTVSSFFLMVLPETPDHPARPVIFSDCGMVVDPDADALAEIARASARSYSQLVGGEPVVAMLSFSTAGSARHERVAKVEAATALLKAQDPGLCVDGEMQFDTAMVPGVAAQKMPGSRVAGQANVFIFPNLDAGNIGYKIAQRIGRATAIGPILQGLARPANDLSRGCTAADVYDLIAVTAVQAQG